jgi:hypothetical protein
MSNDGRKKRMARGLSKSLDQRLTAYTLAAGAAGVVVIACAPPAEAAPVCKTLSATLYRTMTYSFNPAHQAIAPFDLAQTFNEVSSLTFSIRNRLFFTPNSRGANAVLATNGWPADLQAGAKIGPADNFGKGGSYGLMFNYGPGSSATRGHHKGNLQFNATTYIGFKFLIAGKTHYGWLRLETKLLDNTPYTYVQQYGFETVADTAILAGSCGTGQSASDATSAGKMSDNDPSQGSLGALALGAQGIPLWRRK